MKKVLLKFCLTLVMDIMDVRINLWHLDNYVSKVHNTTLFVFTLQTKLLLPMVAGFFICHYTAPTINAF